MLSIGTITGFGSVHVNGVHFVTTGASIVVDGQPGTESDLRVGQVVRVEGQLDSSGTTGTALPLRYTHEALAEEFATLWRARRAAGADLFDANLTFNGQTIVPFAQTRPPFWRTNRWSHQKLFSLYHGTPENLRDYVEEIHRTPAIYAQGYPSAMHLVARHRGTRGSGR